MTEMLLAEIFQLASDKKKLRFMEVCGTHTVAIFRSGIRRILPENIDLISGPGCPICVTNNSFIDKAIEYARRDFIIATFGDMFKITGTHSSLANEAVNTTTKIIYSPLECIELAKKNPARKIIFLAIGFETTAPAIAAMILSAQKQGIKNLFILSALKLISPALRFLLNDSIIQIDGVLLPGHVAVITGANEFQFLIDEFRMSSAISGFEAEEILGAILSLLKQIEENCPKISNNYCSVVRNEGNVIAKKILAEIYDITDAEWRGFGKIINSGLKLRDEFAEFDIERIEPIKLNTSKKISACRCGEILRGIISPIECPLFGKDCNPSHAMGSCMISVEGVCAAWFKYGNSKFNLLKALKENL